MIDSPNENVKLTFEQMQQIDIVQKRLSVLESEITSATKILKGTKSECDRAVKEKLYQEELLANIKEVVEQFTVKKDNLVLEIISHTTEIDNLKEKTTQLNKENYDKESDIIARTKDLDNAEYNFNQKVQDFSTKTNQLLEDQLSIKTAKDAFLKATETVSW